jgi:hypothetical protein
MNTWFNRIAFGGLTRLRGALAWAGRGIPITFRRGVLCALAALLAGGVIWTLVPASDGHVATNRPAQLQLASIDSEQSPAATAAPSGIGTPAAAELDRLRISSQSWRRGGLGSSALVTFTLRNDNDYAVKDVEILCAFARYDGSHLTDRRRVLPESVSMRSRKTFARVHVGFINVNAIEAKCSLVAARRS